MLVRWKFVLLKGAAVAPGAIPRWQLAGTFVQDILAWCVLFALLVPRLRDERPRRRLWAAMALAICNLVLFVEITDVQCKKVFLEPLTWSLLVTTFREAKTLVSSAGSFATPAFVSALIKSMGLFNGSLLLRFLWPRLPEPLRTVRLSPLAPRFAVIAVAPLAVLAFFVPPQPYQLDGNFFTAPLITAARKSRTIASVDLSENCDEPARVLGAADLASAREPTAAIARGRNVVIFIVETLSYAESSFGNPAADHTPLLRELAALGPIVARARAQTPYSTKAIYGILTGRYASPTLEIVESQVARLESLPRTLKSAGYYTAFFTTQFLEWQGIGRQYQAMGFDTIIGGESLRASAEGRGRSVLENDWGLDDREFVASGLLDKLPSDRHFLAVFYNTVSHQPYTYADKRVGTDLERYRLALRYGDDALRAVMDELKRRGHFEDTVFVMLGDHGEDFKDGKWRARGCVLNERSVLVPLVVALPGANAPRSEVTEARQIDVTPTLLDLLGVPADAPVQGRSLLRPSAVAAPAYLNGYGACDVAGIVEGKAKTIYDNYGGSAEVFPLDAESEGPGVRVPTEATAGIVRRLQACAQYNEKALRSQALVGR
jgi:phosphoglycerol transferase MdoB-like AlkP superfamily enzyme